MLYANIRPRIRHRQIVYVSRKIFGNGTITVTKNTEVAPHDIIGKSILSAGYTSLNLAYKLGISAKDCVKFLVKPIGSKIYKGELLASRKGLFGEKAIVSPTDGIIENLNPKTGELRMKFLPKEVTIPAGVFGIVDYVDQISGDILIKAMVNQVFGVLGSGYQRFGVLNILNKASELARENQVNLEMSQQILAIGSFTSNDVLKKAASFGIQGIISGGIDARDYQAMTGSLDPYKKINEDVGVSLVVSEGFGVAPISDEIFKKLLEYNGKFIFINGNKAELVLPIPEPDSILSIRKVALPATRSGNIPPEVKFGELKVGMTVRNIWPPFLGVCGRVIGIDETPTVLESGISTYLVAIETSKSKIKLPFTNLEIIESL